MNNLYLILFIVSIGMKTDRASGRIHDNTGSYQTVPSSPPYRIALAWSLGHRSAACGVLQLSHKTAYMYVYFHNISQQLSLYTNAIILIMPYMDVGEKLWLFCYIILNYIILHYIIIYYIILYYIILYFLPCSTLVDNIWDEKVALPSVAGKPGYGRVTGDLGHTIGPACGA